MNLKKKNVFKEMFNYYKDKKKIPKIDFHIHILDRWKTFCARDG